jgi:hypothetical protein
MLSEPKADQPIQQGDIIQNVPFILLSKVINVKANNVQGQSRLTCEDPGSIDQAKTFSQGNALAASMLPLTIQPGMIVTQGCDIDHRDSITLARIFPLTVLIQEAKDAIDYGEPLVLHEVIRRLTEGHDHPHLVYLGSPDGKVRYAADLLRVQSFPKEWKEYFQKKRWKALTIDGLTYVQARLSFLAGRFATQQGFWHSLEEDEASAKATSGDLGAFDQAKSQLDQKKSAK